MFKVAERLEMSEVFECVCVGGGGRVVPDDSDVRTKSVILGCSEPCLGVLPYQLPFTLLRLDLR